MADTVLVEKKYYTYNDIDYLPEGTFEIIEGEKITMSPTGFEHGECELRLGAFLSNALKDKGYVSVGEVGVLIQKAPLKIRAADIVYISKKKNLVKPKSMVKIPPDLIIEIISPGNTLSDMLEKVQDFLSIGTDRVILIDPKTRTVSIYQKEKNYVLFYGFHEEFEIIEGLKVKIGDII